MPRLCEVLFLPPVLVLFPAFAEIARAQPRDGCVEIGFRILRLHGKRLGIACERFLQASEFQQCVTAIDMGRDNMRFDAQCVFMRIERFVEAIQLCQCNAAMADRRRLDRVYGEGFVKTTKSFGKALASDKDVAPVGQSDHVLGIGPQRTIETGEGLVVPAADQKVYHTIQDMQGYRVGTVIGTNYTDQMRNSGVFSEVVSYNSIADIIRDIGAGRLQAGFGDLPILSYNFAHTPMPQVRLVKEYQPYVVGPINIAVRKDEPALLQKLNASIAKFKSDGTLKAILQKWNL